VIPLSEQARAVRAEIAAARWPLIANFAAAALLAVVLWAMPALAQVRVIDGDTFHAPDRKVRLFGIDAPEIRSRCGQESRMALAGLLLRSGVPLRCERHDKDRYGRSVEQCFTNGMDIGDAMVRAGWAADMPRYSKGLYAMAETDARLHRRGMWGEGGCR
jgi:endonuclease YncB( thermonuclease family)